MDATNPTAPTSARRGNSGPAQEHEAVTYQPCRPSRKQETSWKHIKRAVPPGSMRAAHGLYQALPELRKDERLGLRTRPFQRRLLTFFEKLISLANYDTMTVRVPWGGRTNYFKVAEPDARPGLAEWLGISRRTVGNYLSLLNEWGYLGTVASGRSAEKVREKDTEGNELPIYVICVPSRFAVVQDAGVVDETCTPTAPLGVEGLSPKEDLTRTRAKKLEKQEKGHGFAAPHFWGVASSAPAANVQDRQVPLWPAHATTKRRGQRWAAAAQIRQDCYALRPLSAKDLASVLKPWLKAGWTVHDIKNALDTKPDGSLWPHSGAPVTRRTQRLREWLRTRLSAWTVDGEVMHSPDRRRAAEYAQRVIVQQAERRRELERRVEHAAYLAAGPSDTEIKAKAEIAALLTRNRLERQTKRSWSPWA